MAISEAKIPEEDDRGGLVHKIKEAIRRLYHLDSGEQEQEQNETTYELSISPIRKHLIKLFTLFNF